MRGQPCTTVDSDRRFLSLGPDRPAGRRYFEAWVGPLGLMTASLACETRLGSTPPSSDELAPTDRVKQDMALIGLEPLVQIGSWLWPTIESAGRPLWIRERYDDAIIPRSRAADDAGSAQSPGESWRCRRMVGYQGLVPRQSSQRHSAACGSSTCAGRPSAPAR